MPLPQSDEALPCSSSSSASSLSSSSPVCEEEGQVLAGSISLAGRWCSSSHGAWTASPAYLPIITERWPAFSTSGSSTAPQAGGTIATRAAASHSGRRGVERSRRRRPPTEWSCPRVQHTSKSDLCGVFFHKGWRQRPSASWSFCRSWLWACWAPRSASRHRRRTPPLTVSRETGWARAPAVPARSRIVLCWSCWREM